MLFNSSVFLVFALVFFGVWHALRRQPTRLAFVVLASFFFYGYWNWRFLFLLLGSGAVDFLAGLFLERERRPLRRRLAVALSILVNLGILGTFKYLGFLGQALSDVGALAGFEIAPPSGFHDIVLPVGISFYTFQSMSYTLDVYAGRCRATRSPLLFFAYLSLFPQLVAGPIERPGHLMGQLAERRTPSPAQVYEGWRLIVWGFFQKVALADNLAPRVDEAFSDYRTWDSGLSWWLIAAMFAAQILCDFAGYTNIARGLAKWMGLDLVVNFDRPYTAASFREFWGRWHISLSTWFRDYVYKPLGGSRRGVVRAHVALWITLLASGLWHGAGWTFLCWGAFHAAMLSLERITHWSEWLGKRGWLGRLAAQMTVLVGVLAGWVLFRADSIPQAGLILGRMFDPASFTNPLTGLSMPLLAFGAALMGWLASTYGALRRCPIPLRRLEPALLPFLVVITLYFRGPGHAFIYFQF